MNQLSQQMREAIQALQHCHATCHAMAMTHCLETGGLHAAPQHLRLMLDCAAFCAFTADALGRKSQFQHRYAALCAEVCDVCAADCAVIGGMDPCVEACRHCAGLCLELARMDHGNSLADASQHIPQ